jgi:antitoxin component of MazEF toxin-antitoxin module
MSNVFQVKLEEIGDSLGFIIPSEIVKERGLQEGDIIQIEILPTSFEERNEKIRKIVGVYKGTSPFKREKEDRY